MADWQYLLQKEGDRSWLPLKPSGVELPEGRYRVVAHSNRANTDVEIRITHYSTDEVPPKRRSQKRSHRTNAEGLMVVIPFTYIKPGIWNVRIKNDIMSDLLGDTWQAGIQIRVLPKEIQKDALPSSNVEPKEAAVGASSVRGASGNAVAVAVTSSRTETKAPASPIAPANEITASSSQPFTKQASAVQLKLEVESNQESEKVASGCADTSASGDDIETFSSAQDSTLKESTPPSLPLEESDVCSDKTSMPANGLRIDSLQMVEETGEQENRETVSSIAEFVESRDRINISPAQNSTATENISSPLLENSSSSPPPDAAHLDKEVVPVDDLLADSLQMAEQILQQLMDQVWEEPEPTTDDENAQTGNFNSPQPQNTPWQPADNRQEAQPAASIDTQALQSQEFSLSPAAASANQSALALTLDQEALVGRLGQSLTVTGRVDVAQATALDDSDIKSDLKSIFKGTLQYQLRDPQTSQILMGGQRLLPEQVPPFAFTLTFELPPNCETRLLLGEVMICDADGVAIATQTFSITADLRDLLDTILHKSQAVSPVQMPVSAEPVQQESQPEPSPELLADENRNPVVNLDLPLLNLGEKAKNLQSFQPSPRQTLPPQIIQPSSTKKRANKSPELPKLPVMQFPEQPASMLALTTKDMPVQALLLEQTGNGAGSKELQTDAQPISSLLPVENPLALQDSEELGIAKVDFQQERADAAPSSLSLTRDEAPSSELVESPQQTQIAPAVVLETDIAPETLVDFWLDSPSDELASDFESSRNLGLEATDEEPTIIQATPGSLESYTLNLPELDVDFLSVGETRADEKQELLSGQGSEGSHNSQVLKEEAEAEPNLGESGQDLVEQAFQSLRMQERFWLRLNAIAADSELSESLRSESQALDRLEEREPDTDYLSEDLDLLIHDAEQEQQLLLENTALENSINTASPQEPAQSSEPPHQETKGFPKAERLPESPPKESRKQSQVPLESAGMDWSAQEIVVDDDELPPPKKVVQRTPAQIVDYLSDPQAVFKILEEVPVPTPELDIPEGELTAGELLTIWIKLPPYQDPVYVKLWIQDLQSRYMLDGPRLFKEFSANSAGELETIAQLSVPFGSLSIRFEAIVVDMYTQRESHKVTVDRNVLPPDIPTISLDDFEE